MRLSSQVGTTAAVALGLLLVAAQARASSCTTQAALAATDRDALAAAGGRLATAVAAEDLAGLQSALLASEAGDWEGIRETAQAGAPLLKGGQVQLENLYLLDATALTAPADTQFFCSNASGSLTVTITMRSLPPGRYAVVLATAAGAPLAGQIGLVLAWDAGAWKLGGLTVRQGSFDGHDSVWFWTRARELAKADQIWSAWFSYETARYLSVPVDFLSSPNMEKLNQEQGQLKGSPQDAFPYSLQDGDRIWKIDGVRLDASLHEPDLAVTYESTGVTDQAAIRTEATAVLSALLKAQPGLRQNFHGMWAVAAKGGKQNAVLELPMGQIP